MVHISQSMTLRLMQVIKEGGREGREGGRGGREGGEGGERESGQWCDYEVLPN